MVVFVGIFLLVGIGYRIFQLSKSRTFQFFGGLTARVDTDTPVVALTFDDAPSQYTDTVLRILKAKNVSATFYCIGKNIEEYPEQARAIVESGHELGNHSYSHTRLIFKSLPFIAGEIDKTNERIRQAGYTDTITFRPPNGKKLLLLPWYLYTHHIQTVMWDVEPDTYVGGKPAEIVSYVEQHARPGSIILMHPFCGQECEADREALPGVIDRLTAKGYRFVPVSQLLSFVGKNP